jgi:subtilisin family serine protease
MGHQYRRVYPRAANPTACFVQQLESRQLFSSTVAPLSTNGLVPIRWHGQNTYAASGQWIAVINRPLNGSHKQLAILNDQLAGSGLGAVRRLNHSSLFLLRGKEQPLADVKAVLAKLPGFVEVEPDIARQTQSIPDDPNFSSQWGLNQNTSAASIHAVSAWNLTFGSRSVVTAVLDTGVDYTHPDLAANIWTNPGEIPGNGIDDDGNGYVDDVRGWDFANADNDPMDDNGHGTMVAGVIGSVGNNSIGVTGVNWQTKIMPLKYIGANGVGYTSNAVAALNYVADLKSRGVNIRVVNNSSIGNYSVALQVAIDALNTAGIFFVAGAGNGGADYVGDDNDVNPTYPASLPEDNVISVAATDSNDQLASFSNYGATSVDLAAPGVNILSTAMGGSYGWSTGTSDSTPFVSGVAALAFAYAPNATLAQVKAAIINGCDKLPGLAGKCVSGGRLDAYNTLALLVAPASGTGLSVSWYDTPDLSGPGVAGPAAAINYNWVGGSPDARIAPDTFSARWTGQVQPQYSETYTFYTLADDGVRVWVNGQLLIDRWSNHPPMGDANADGKVNALDFDLIASNYGATGTAAQPYDLNGDNKIDQLDFDVLATSFNRTVDPIQNSGSIALVGGQLYNITVEYFDNTGVASMKLSWSSPSTPKQIVPASRLYPTTATASAVEALSSTSLFSDKTIENANDTVLN